MKKLTVIKPYDDDKLIWNEQDGRYELAFEFCKKEYDANFVDDDVLKRRIKKNSRVVYQFIEYRVNSKNRPLVVSMLYRTKEGRDFIFEMLRTQFEADVENGYNDLGNTPAINVSNGQVIDRAEIRRNLVSVATEQVFDDSNVYFGVNLGYQGVFPSYYYYFLMNA